MFDPPPTLPLSPNCDALSPSGALTDRNASSRNATGGSTTTSREGSSTSSRHQGTTTSSTQRVLSLVVDRLSHAWELAQKQGGSFLFPDAVFPDVDTGRKLQQRVAELTPQMWSLEREITDLPIKMALRQAFVKMRTEANVISSCEALLETLSNLEKSAAASSGSISLPAIHDKIEDTRASLLHWVNVARQERLTNHPVIQKIATTEWCDVDLDDASLIQEKKTKLSSETSSASSNTNASRRTSSPLSNRTNQSSINSQRSHISSSSSNVSSLISSHNQHHTSQTGRTQPHGPLIAEVRATEPSPPPIRTTHSFEDAWEQKLAGSNPSSSNQNSSSHSHTELPLQTIINSAGQSPHHTPRVFSVSADSSKPSNQHIHEQPTPSQRVSVSSSTLDVGVTAHFGSVEVSVTQQVDEKSKEDIKIVPQQPRDVHTSEPIPSKSPNHPIINTLTIHDALPSTSEPSRGNPELSTARNDAASPSVSFAPTTTLVASLTDRPSTARLQQHQQLQQPHSARCPPSYDPHQPPVPPSRLSDRHPSKESDDDCSSSIVLLDGCHANKRSNNKLRRSRHPQFPPIGHITADGFFESKNEDSDEASSSLLSGSPKTTSPTSRHPRGLHKRQSSIPPSGSIARQGLFQTCCDARQGADKKASVNVSGDDEQSPFHGGSERSGSPVSVRDKPINGVNGITDANGNSSTHGGNGLSGRFKNFKLKPLPTKSMPRIEDGKEDEELGDDDDGDGSKSPLPLIRVTGTQSQHGSPRKDSKTARATNRPEEQSNQLTRSLMKIHDQNQTSEERIDHQDANSQTHEHRRPSTDCSNLEEDQNNGTTTVPEGGRRSSFLSVLSGSNKRYYRKPDALHKFIDRVNPEDVFDDSDDDNGSSIHILTLHSASSFASLSLRSQESKARSTMTSVTQLGESTSQQQRRDSGQSSHNVPTDVIQSLSRHLKAQQKLDRVIEDSKNKAKSSRSNSREPSETIPVDPFINAATSSTSEGSAKRPLRRWFSCCHSINPPELNEHHLEESSSTTHDTSGANVDLSLTSEDVPTTASFSPDSSMRSSMRLRTIKSRSATSARVHHQQDNYDRHLQQQIQISSTPLHAYPPDDLVDRWLRSTPRLRRFHEEVEDKDVIKVEDSTNLDKFDLPLQVFNF